MATTSLLNTVWSSRFLFNLQNDLVFGNIVSADYEGDAANASIVKINSLGKVTTSAYTGSISVQELASTSQDLAIDQRDYFAFSVDDLLKAQSKNAIVEEAMSTAAYATIEAVDKFIAGKYTEVTHGTGSITIDAASEAYDFIVDTAVKLSEQGVSKANRFIVLPEFVGGMVAKDSRWTLIPGVLMGGVQGYKVAGMDVYFSNNVCKVDANYKVIAGDKKAIAYVGALKTIEAYRPEGSFADAVKGQFVYGGKVINAGALCVQNISK